MKCSLLWMWWMMQLHRGPDVPRRSSGTGCWRGCTSRPSPAQPCSCPRRPCKRPAGWPGSGAEREKVLWWKFHFVKNKKSVSWDFLRASCHSPKTHWAKLSLSVRVNGDFFFLCGPVINWLPVQAVTIRPDTTVIGSCTMYDSQCRKSHDRQWDGHFYNPDQNNSCFAKHTGWLTLVLKEIQNIPSLDLFWHQLKDPTRCCVHIIQFI